MVKGFLSLAPLGVEETGSGQEEGLPSAWNEREGKMEGTYGSVKTLFLF